MPTKKELLEEKTVKELKQMARDRDLSGYYDMKKSELIELIGDNYLKNEIKKWPALGVKEVGRGEKVVEEKKDEEEEEASVPMKEVEVDEGFGPEWDLVFTLLVLGSALSSILAIIALYLYF